jgi:hypothetical protein
MFLQLCRISGGFTRDLESSRVKKKEEDEKGTISQGPNYRFD